MQGLHSNENPSFCHPYIYFSNSHGGIPKMYQQFEIEINGFFCSRKEALKSIPYKYGHGAFVKGQHKR